MQSSKLMLFGNGDSGKTTLCRILTTSEYIEDYSPTLGLEVYGHGNFTIWDVAGQDRFGGLRTAYFLQGECGILCINGSTYFDIVRTNYWKSIFDEMCSNKKLVIFVTKMDNEIPEEIEKIVTYASDHNLECYFISAKSRMLPPSFDQIFN